MPNPSNSPETAAIEAAYRAHVELLFKSLVTNLGDQVVSHQSDQQSLDKFKAGLNVAKRAKRLALNASPLRWLQVLLHHEEGNARNNPGIGTSPRQRTSATQVVLASPDVAGRSLGCERRCKVRLAVDWQAMQRPTMKFVKCATMRAHEIDISELLRRAP